MWRRRGPLTNDGRIGRQQAFNAERAEFGVQPIGEGDRIGEQVRVVDQHAQFTATRRECSTRVLLPQCERECAPNPITRVQRIRNFVRIAHDMHKHRAGQQRQQLACDQAQARFLDQPWAVRVEHVEDGRDLASERVDRGGRCSGRRLLPSTARGGQTTPAGAVQRPRFVVAFRVVRADQ